VAGEDARGKVGNDPWRTLTRCGPGGAAWAVAMLGRFRGVTASTIGYLWPRQCHGAVRAVLIA